MKDIPPLTKCRILAIPDESMKTRQGAFPPLTGDEVLATDHRSSRAIWFIETRVRYGIWLFPENVAPIKTEDHHGE